jgi:hypothetical protein
METKKRQIVQYEDGVASYDAATPLTVAHLKALIKRLHIPDATVLAGSSDEEGNGYGRIYLVAYDDPKTRMNEMPDGMEIEGIDPDKPLIIFMPDL